MIVVSEHYSLLTIAIETFLSLIFPRKYTILDIRLKLKSEIVKWQHILIPILPARLMTYLQAPMPYIIGIHSSYRHLEDPPRDVSKDLHHGARLIQPNTGNGSEHGQQFLDTTRI